MPQATSSYDKIIVQCSKNNWVDYPPFQKIFNYDELFKIINYSVPRIELGKTHKPKTWDEYLNLILKYNSFKRGVFLEKMIFVYGKEKGTLKFNEYRRKQAITNTYEYKKVKYGISLDEFNEYNKSRAVTLDNLIKKYGENDGKNRYDEYCKRQAFTNTVEYLGEERYKKVNKLKSHSLDTYIQRYGEEIGRKKLLEFYEKSSCGNSYSKISQRCFNEVEEFLTEFEREYTYYATKNKEYALLYENKCFLYDFVCTHLKFCIEYHGDHFHGNPLIYKPDSHLRGRGCTHMKAKEKWKQDELKAKWLEDQRGYVTIIVWDSEWRNDPSKVLEKIKKFISNRREFTI
jgi:very-short-patch-repair endonuclease